MPPARTGVADYSAALVRALARVADVEVNARQADVFLYHLGNNGQHREIYQQALERPGVIVLHDAVLHHFMLGTLEERRYIEEFCYNYGGWSEDLARDLWRGRARWATDYRYFRYPMLKRVVERSLGVVVHNPRAAAMVAAHAPGTPIFEIPHLFERPAELAPEFDVIRLRDYMGIAPHVFLFGVFGHLRESKRLAVALRAFEKTRGAADEALLVAGDFVSSDLARSMAGALGGTTGIVRIGHTSERDFWRYAAACDACINLRYPAAGETSGIAIRLMGIGKPVILSTGEETARFPEAGCLRVDPGPAEEEMLADYMVWLARSRADAETIGHRGAAHIREFHATAQVASLYKDALANCYHKI